MVFLFFYLREKIMKREELANVFLDWKNNFLTVAGFAEYYGLHDNEAYELINLARQCFENPHPDA
jgi:hypothetical protein